MALCVPDYVLSLTREQAGEFFLVFARFEFALKASGFTRDGQWGPETDWNAYADAMAPRFNWSRSPELERAIEYLFLDPPKQPHFVDRALQWEPRTPRPNWSRMRQLLFHVQGVRNNLFHGAKFLQRESEDRDRDPKLVNAALLILEECLR